MAKCSKTDGKPGNAMEGVSAFASAAQSLCATDGPAASTLDWGRPILFRMDPNMDELKDDSKFVSACNAFATRFARAPERLSPGRGQRKMAQDAADSYLALTQTVLRLQGSQPGPEFTENVKVAMAPTVWAAAKDLVTPAPESGHLASIRTCIKGSRELLCVPTLTLWQYLEALDPPPSPTMSVTVLCNWIKHATVDDWKSFVANASAANLVHVTAGPKDLFYLPPAWTFLEKVGSHDVCGARMQFVVQQHEPALSKFSKQLLAVMKPNAVLQEAWAALQ